MYIGYKEFIPEGMNENDAQGILEAVEEFLCEAIKHMSASDKLQAKAYRKSAAGKKALKKFAKKASKAGYKPDPNRSKLMKKVAGMRNESEEVFEDTDLSPDEIADIEELLENFIDFVYEEKINEAEDDVQDVDPETGEESDDDDMDEAIKHMSAKERMAAKKYRKSAAGKKALKKYMKKASKVGYRVDPSRSRVAKKTASQRREAIEEMFAELSEDELQALDEFIMSIVEQADDIKKELDELDPDDEDLKKELEKDETDDELDDEDDDELDDEDDDELDEKRMSAAEKTAAKKYRKSAAGKKALKKYAKKIKKAGYKVDKALSQKMKKVARTRAESIEEQIEIAFQTSGLLGSLNESESVELKSAFSNACSSYLKEADEKIFESVSASFENYINEELLEQIADYFEQEVVPSLRESLNEDVSNYLQYIAEDIASDMSDKKLIVKSPKTVMMEEFTDELISLMNSKLYSFESDDAVLKLQESIDTLRDAVDDAKVESARYKNELSEMKKEQYVLKHNKYNKLSEVSKEAVEEFMNENLCEDFDEFASNMDDFINERLGEKKQLKESVEPSKKSEKNSTSFADIVKAMGR